MDLFDELEKLAVSAAYEEPEEDSSTHDPSYATIKMWQDRFGYTYDEAATLIGITKSTATKVSAQQPMLSPAQARTIYLLKLDGPFYSHKVIENWLSGQNNDFKPLFVPFGRAYKELCSSSLYPTLGIDTTLPQFRPQDSHLLHHAPSFGRAQDQFPVWYFFYGTLASAPKLCSLLSLPEDGIPILHKASVTGGKMETWGNGKYNALVDGPESSRIDGWAYQVTSEEHEDALRKYETAAYEVVKCEIEMNDNTVQGSTFRFADTFD
ncbi:hypothetical protein IFR05_006007 [Cadophora sp. M221]|nr:hypothetical protein IFR05_006007 [Cadophora sp. M221]